MTDAHEPAERGDRIVIGAEDLDESIPAEPIASAGRPTAPAVGTPQSAPQPPTSAPQYGAPQYGAPQYGAPQYGAPQYGEPQYGAPQYGEPQYGAPQYGAPQYGAPPYPPPAFGGTQPTFQAGAPGMPFGARPTNPLAKLNGNSVLSGLVAGAGGGLVAAIVAEILWFGIFAHVLFPHINDSSILPEFTRPSKVQLNLYSACWTLVFGAVIGFVLLAWEGFTSGSPQKGAIDGGWGALAGAGAGLVGGYLAQALYTSMLEGLSSTDTLTTLHWKLRLARAVGWGLFGLLIGLGIGIKSGGRKILNGLIGGAVGGALGGLIFEQLAQWQVTTSSAVLRILGVTITGLVIGVAIGLVDRIRRDSWLVVTAGPMTGKEIILFKPQTTIGSDYRADLVLVKDPGVALQHLSLIRDAHGNVTMSVAPGALVTVNGAPVQGHRLRPGDVLGVGSSVLQFQQRVATVAPAF